MTPEQLAALETVPHVNETPKTEHDRADVLTTRAVRVCPICDIADCAAHRPEADDLVERLLDAMPVTQDFEHTLQGALLEEAAARIEALTAQIAGLTKERDGYQDICNQREEIIQARTARAEAAETEVARLRGALERIAADMTNVPASGCRAAITQKDRTDDE